MCGKQALPPLILSKSRMRKRARTDLRGGRSAMIVPTATVIRQRRTYDLASQTALWYGILRGMVFLPP